MEPAVIPAKQPEFYFTVFPNTLPVRACRKILHISLAVLSLLGRIFLLPFSFFFKERNQIEDLTKEMQQDLENSLNTLPTGEWELDAIEKDARRGNMDLKINNETCESGPFTTKVIELFKATDFNEIPLWTGQGAFSPFLPVFEKLGFSLDSSSSKSQYLEINCDDDFIEVKRAQTNFSLRDIENPEELSKRIFTLAIRARFDKKTKKVEHSFFLVNQKGKTTESGSAVYAKHISPLIAKKTIDI